MDTTRIEAALGAVGATTGLHTAAPRPLRLHDAAIFLLVREQVVVRLLAATAVNVARAATAVQVTGWLATQDFPAVRPAWPAPIRIEGYVATLWQYLPQPESRRRPPDIVLGRLVRDLHRLPTPPFPLRPADPLARLRQAIDLDQTRTTPALTDQQRAFCEQRIADLAAAYTTLDTPLGEGLIHNDAHSGNLLTAPDSPYGYVLGDWDGACHGPREIDLIPVGAPGNRFGDRETERAQFVTGYGYDIATWPQYTILRDIRDLHSIASYIRTAPHKPAAGDELQRRLHSLQSGDRTIPWKTVQ